MAFSEFESARLTRLLNAWCDAVPMRVRDQLRRGFRIVGHEVVIFESRPHFQPPHEWHDYDIAKFRYVRAANEWRLFCRFRDGRWRAYAPMASAATFDALFAEVQRDPTHIFWG